MRDNEECSNVIDFIIFTGLIPQETKDQSDQRVVHSIGAAYGIAQVSYKVCR